MVKIIISVFSIIALLILLTYSYNFYQNNRQVNRPDQNEITRALDKSIDWLHENRNTIETTHNPALWWMLKEASEIADNTELTAIYHGYKTSYLDRMPVNIWTPYFQKYYKPRVPDILSLQNFRDYQIFFVYALSCDSDLGSEPIVQKQLKPDFCTWHFLFPRCITHQQMGVRLMQQRNCGNSEALSQLSEALTDKIQSELVWDYRVGDAYLQRALMLAEVGRVADIKPIWIKRILDAQNPDGGWDDIHPIINMGDTTLGHTSKLPIISNLKSNFHATAQGIWLMSLLLNQYSTVLPHQPEEP